MLRDTQAQSFEVIKRLELRVQTLSEERTEDKKRIEGLERELRNCSQEIDYLQDQLNLRNTEVNCLGEHVCSLQLKLTAMEDLEEVVERLREELKSSMADRLILQQELENKESELHTSSMCIAKLEESMSSVGLEYQCEIESMKLELMAVEHNYFEAKKSLEEGAQENSRLRESIEELEHRIQEAEKEIDCLDKENGDLMEKFQASEMNAKYFCKKVEEQFQECLGNYSGQMASVQDKYISTCGIILGPLLSKLAVIGGSDAILKDKMEKMSSQMEEYDSLVRKLKEELREEKLKAREEAEDLAQEMAELRYRITELLEEECKRRACIEQISLQRIAELEAQIKKEQGKSKTPQEQRNSITDAGHNQDA